MPDLPRQFTDKERAILSIVQKDLPDSQTPYADIAKITGSTEEEVLALLTSMLDDGSIRRFGASIKHQKAGYTENAMVAWLVAKDEADEAGRQAATHPMVSHCYYRPSVLPDWPYELYTMIHGKAVGDCSKVIEELQQTTLLKEYAVLESLRELKKTSMIYF